MEGSSPVTRRRSTTNRMTCLFFASVCLVSAVPLGSNAARADDGDLFAGLESRGYVCIPLTRLKSEHLVLSVKCGTESLILLLDTGAPFTQFDPERVRRLRIDWLPDREEFGQFYFYAEKLAIGKTETGRLLIGNYNVSFLNVHNARYGDAPIDGLLGADILRAHSAIIDHAGARLFLRPVGASAKNPLPPAVAAAASLGFVALAQQGDQAYSAGNSTRAYQLYTQALGQTNDPAWQQYLRGMIARIAPQQQNR
jgi:hypothetical protein